MTDIALPSNLCPSKVTWTLDRNRAIAESPYSRVAQTQGRAGDRWRATVSWETMMGDPAYALATWLDQVSKVGNYALLPAQQNDIRGDFNAVQSPDLSLSWGTPGELAKWTQDEKITAKVNTSGLNIYNQDGVPGPLSRAFPFQANYFHVAILDIPAATTPGWRLYIADELGVLYDQTSTARGRFVIPILPRSVVSLVRLYATVNAETSQPRNFGDFQLYRVLRTEILAGAGAETISFKGNDPSSNNVQFKAGQFLTLLTSSGPQMVRVCEDVVSIGSAIEFGNSVYVRGVAFFEPALRSSVAADTIVLHRRPWCRMRLATAASAADLSPPLLHGFSVDFVEEL